MSDEEDITFSDGFIDEDLFSSTFDDDQHPISKNQSSTSIESNLSNENSVDTELSSKRKFMKRKTESDVDKIVRLISDSQPAIREEKTCNEKPEASATTTASPHSEQEKRIKEYRQLLDKFTTLFGSEHLRTNEIKHILAARLYKAGQFNQALELFTKLKDFYGKQKDDGVNVNENEPMLNVSEKCLLCRIMLNDVSGVADKIGEMCTQYKTVRLYDDTEVWKHVNKFVECLVEKKHFTEAGHVLENLLSNAEKSLSVNDVGDDEDEFMDMMKQMKMKLAGCYRSSKEHRKSLDVNLDVYSLAQDGEYTLVQEEVLTIKEEIADLYCRVEDFENALGMYFELYSDYIELHGGECAETLSIRTSIAEVLLRQEKVEDALKIYMAVFESYLNLPNTKESIKVHMKHIIGHVYLKEERLFEALQTFRDVLHEYTLLHHGNDSHTDILEAKTSVACALLKEKKFEESKTLYKQVWECYKEIRGEDDEKSSGIEKILVDLDRLDLMFTSEDRKVIGENVRLNEETHFGSQDFDKYILPKLTFSENKDVNENKVTDNGEGEEEQEKGEINAEENYNNKAYDGNDSLEQDDGNISPSEIEANKNTTEITGDDGQIRDSNEEEEALGLFGKEEQDSLKEDSDNEKPQQGKISDDVENILRGETKESQGRNDRDTSPSEDGNIDKEGKKEQHGIKEDVPNHEQLSCEKKFSQAQEMDKQPSEYKFSQAGGNGLTQTREIDNLPDDNDLDWEGNLQNQTQVSPAGENNTENEGGSENEWDDIPLNPSVDSLDDDIMDNIREQNEKRKGAKKKKKGSCCVIS